MKRATPPRPLPVAKLRWRCQPQQLGFRTTAEVRSRPEIIGQPRALSAMRLGLEIQSPGYNIFVVGLTGTGKLTALKRVFKDTKLPGGVPDDLCYVHNFLTLEAPRALRLPAGKGRALRRDMQRFIDDLQRALPDVYESDAFAQQRRKLIDTFKERGRVVLAEFESRVEADGFQIVQVQVGPITQAALHAVVASEPLPLEKLQELADQGRFAVKDLARLKAKHAKLETHLQAVVKTGRKIERELRDRVRDLERKFAAMAMRDPLQELREEYANMAGVLEHLDAVESSILDSVSGFVRAARSEDQAEESDVSSAAADLSLYAVNVVVDNANAERPPVIIEASPTFRNLFGCIETAPDQHGMWRSDFTKIRAGSLLAANGGYLVFSLADTAGDPGVWPTLKRSLKNRRAEIRNLEVPSAMQGPSLKPEGVDLNVKVAVAGDPYLYQLLFSYDDEFRKIFKVKADFDSSMPRTQRSLRQYANFVAELAKTENLLAFDAGAVAELIETGARYAGRQTRLATRFSDIADVAREAHYWAVKQQAKVVRAAHVDQAVLQRTQRVSLLEDHVQHSIETGSLLLDLRGMKIGQVNALTVYDVGDHVFGRPSRITCEVSMGRSGIINIEREANLSGSTHDKGVLILAGYLRRKYAQVRPLTLSASIAFEQSYGGVDGDSASAAEVLALMSAISEMPLRQDLAVTGSVNQKGELQPIGSVNEKVEGFYDACRARGLTGTQGVVIPSQNAPELMLRKDVLSAVRARRFHVYALKSIDAALELMTGVKAGRRTRSGYEPDTMHRVVDEALAHLAEDIKEFVEGADTPSSRPPAQGLADDEDDDGTELGRKRSRKRGGRKRR